MENVSIETVMTYVVAFLSSSVGATLLTIVIKAIVNAVAGYKTKKVSKLTDGDKDEIANKVTQKVLTAISGGVSIDAEAMIDKATNKRLDAYDAKFNEFSTVINKLYSLGIAQGKVLVDLKTPSLAARENLASAIGESKTEIKHIATPEQPKLSVTLSEEQVTEKETAAVSY